MKITKPRKKAGGTGSSISGGIKKQFPKQASCVSSTEVYVKAYFRLNSGFQPCIYVCGERKFTA